MKKTFKITFVVLFLGLIPMSCKRDNCGEVTNYKDYHIISFSINTTDLKGLNVDTSLYLDFDSVVKSIQIDKTQDEVNNIKLDINMFSQTVDACDPKRPSPLEKIKEIIIISKSEIGVVPNKISSGDTITELFLWKNEGSTEYKKFWMYSMPENIKKNYGILLKLKERFFENTDFKFDIKIELSDNSIHEFNDQVLKVK